MPRPVAKFPPVDKHPVRASRLSRMSLLAIPLAGLLAVGARATSAAAQETMGHDMDHMQKDHIGDMAMPGHTETSSKTPEELAEDKRFSEGNHHLAGVFVLLVGLLAVLEPWISERQRWARYLWSFLFFAPGVYLMIWSDPESWPTG